MGTGRFENKVVTGGALGTGATIVIDDGQTVTTGIPSFNNYLEKLQQQFN